MQQFDKLPDLSRFRKQAPNQRLSQQDKEAIMASEKTPEQIADLYGISESWARQLMDKGKKRKKS